MQAALLRVKLKHLDEEIDDRRNVARAYLNGIISPPISLPEWEVEEQNGFYLFVVRCSQRNKLQAYLKRQGIQTLIHYPVPPHRQKAYESMADFDFLITELIHKEVVSLPMGPY